MGNTKIMDETWAHNKNFFIIDDNNEVRGQFPRFRLKIASFIQHTYLKSLIFVQKFIFDKTLDFEQKLNLQNIGKI